MRAVSPTVSAGRGCGASRSRGCRLAGLGLAAALIAGCGLGAGAAHPGTVTLTITRGFGQRQLATAGANGIRPSDTVMRLLESRRRVTTAYGGGYVQSIDGLAGTRAGRHDWFYYVNGSEATTGAADFSLAPGEQVQWDYHRWDGTLHIPAIVGAYPHPFSSDPRGHPGRPTVECAAAVGRAVCATARRHLSTAGATVAERPFGSAAGSGAVLMLVGPWSSLRSDPAAAGLERGPAASGVFARFDPAGTALELLDPSGRTVRAAPQDSGLVAATQAPDGAIVWLVTGGDSAAVGHAVDALDAGRLRNRFALAVTPGGDLALPLGGDS